jgi:hypothetical protein
MSIRRRIALLLASAAALGVGFIAFPGSAAAVAPPVVPTCTPKASTGSDSCVRGTVSAINAPLGGTLEPIRLGTRVRSVFSPVNDETTKVIVRYDDDGQVNLAGIPTCPASELNGKNIAQAFEQCGPGADGNPASEGNAYLSSPNAVSGIASTVPPGNITACTMVFKGADNNHVTLYARAVGTNPTACNSNPATNTAPGATVIFTGILSHQPASSPYDSTLTVPNTQTANPALDDYYATIQRGVKARCPAGASPLKVQAVFDYTTTPTDTISPPYPGTTDPCP